MFEIGSSLREARTRLGLEVADVVAETKIRAKYLTALEEERFDLLPERAYARSLLRSYATFLGLEAQLYLDEFDARFPSEEPVRARAPVRGRGVVPRRLVPALALLGAVGLLLYLGELRSCS